MAPVHSKVPIAHLDSLHHRLKKANGEILKHKCNQTALQMRLSQCSKRIYELEVQSGLGSPTSAPPRRSRRGIEKNAKLLEQERASHRRLFDRQSAAENKIRKCEREIKELEKEISRIKSGRGERSQRALAPSGQQEPIPSSSKAVRLRIIKFEESDDSDDSTHTVEIQRERNDGGLRDIAPSTSAPPRPSASTRHQPPSTAPPRPLQPAQVPTENREILELREMLKTYKLEAEEKEKAVKDATNMLDSLQSQAAADRNEIARLRTTMARFESELKGGRERDTKRLKLINELQQILQEKDRQPPVSDARLAELHSLRETLNARELAESQRLDLESKRQQDGIIFLQEMDAELRQKSSELTQKDAIIVQQKKLLIDHSVARDRLERRMHNIEAALAAEKLCFAQRVAAFQDEIKVKDQNIMAAGQKLVNLESRLKQMEENSVILRKEKVANEAEYARKLQHAQEEKRKARKRSVLAWADVNTVIHRHLKEVGPAPSVVNPAVPVPGPSSRPPSPRAEVEPETVRKTRWAQFASLIYSKLPWSINFEAFRLSSNTGSGDTPVPQQRTSAPRPSMLAGMQNQGPNSGAGRASVPNRSGINELDPRLNRHRVSGPPTPYLRNAQKRAAPSGPGTQQQQQ